MMPVTLHINMNLHVPYSFAHILKRGICYTNQGGLE